MFEVSEEDDADLWRIFGEAAEELAVHTGVSIAQGLLTLCKHWVKYNPEAIIDRLDREDKRGIQWTAEVKIWVFTTPGDYESTELYAESGAEPFSPLSGLVMVLRDLIESAHDVKADSIVGVKNPSPFKVRELAMHIGRIRPSISRGGGVCVTRIPYSDCGTGYMMQIEVSKGA